MTNKGQDGASTSAKSRDESQTLQNRPKTGTEGYSRSAIFASEHHAARRYRCPSCAAAQGRDCTPVAGTAIHRRGLRWHHEYRYSLVLARDPQRSAERAKLIAAISAASFSKNPKPGPPRRLARAPDGSIETHLRSALAQFHRGSTPETVQAALESAGLTLGLEAVKLWLSQLNN